jgi:hypothetical protein
MELEVTPVFPTLIGQLRVPDSDAMNQELRELILAVETKHATLGRSNIGGWHSRPDFLNSSEASVGALTAWITWGVKHMVDASAGSGVFNGTISLSAWATTCRDGAYHAPHSHPDSAWSGVYYVDPGVGNPGRPLSGVLEFLDPRASGPRQLGDRAGLSLPPTHMPDNVQNFRPNSYATYRLRSGRTTALQRSRDIPLAAFALSIN